MIQKLMENIFGILENLKDNDDKNEKYLKYLKALVEYCKKYLYIITDYPCSNENDELVKKLVKDYISNN